MAEAFNEIEGVETLALYCTRKSGLVQVIELFPGANDPLGIEPIKAIDNYEMDGIVDTDGMGFQRLWLPEF